MAEVNSPFARRMMAQKLMMDNKTNPFEQSEFFQPSDALEAPRVTGMLLPFSARRFGDEKDLRLAVPELVSDFFDATVGNTGKALGGELGVPSVNNPAFTGAVADMGMNVTGGSLLGSALTKSVPKNALSMGLYSDTSNRFLHGTLTDNISDIKKTGLIPGVGKNTKEAYGEYSDLLEDALYVSRPEDAERALSAIRNQVGIKLKKQASEVTDQDIVDNGALVVTRSKKDTAIYEAGEGGETFSISGEKSYFDTNVSDEAGDIVSKDILPATGILKGKALKKFFEKQGLLSSGSRATKTKE